MMGNGKCAVQDKDMDNDKIRNINYSIHNEVVGNLKNVRQSIHNEVV